jgi:hypothetical protein
MDLSQPSISHLGTPVTKPSKKRSLQQMYDSGVLRPQERNPDKRRKLAESAEQFLRRELEEREALKA